MISLPGYDIIEQTESRNGFARFLARQSRSGQPVTLKFIPADPSVLSGPESMETACAALMAIHSAHVGRVYAIEKVTAGPETGIVIVMDPARGIPLSEFWRKGKLSMERFLDIAIDLATAVNDLHKAGIVHRGLTGDAILINPETETVRVDDFAPPLLPGRPAGLLNEEEIRLSGITENHLPYLSPEQTGRMNRPVDFRTDFYSLGIIFYALLTGDLPFRGDTPGEILHGHIAHRPVPPAEARQDIAGPVSDIVMRLLAKTPEERYQSAYGLRADLTECRRMLNAYGEIETSFALGGNDAPETFAISEGIFGREKEIHRLCMEFERIRRGDVSVVWITGGSGMGKTRLVSAFENFVSEASGYFISGRHEPIGENIPYSAIIQAFQGMIRQILTQSADRVDTWRRHLLSTLGTNAGVIVSVIPELEYIIGKQPEPAELPPADTQNRFNITFEKFFRSFGTRENPLVVFIDNMQWADMASLWQMEAFFTESPARHILFIGAGRQDDIDPTHPVSRTLEAISRKKGRTFEIRLGPLSLAEIEALIADTLKRTMPEISPLARVLHEKTGGNPSSVRQLLTTLNADGVLFYDFDNGVWQWSVDDARAKRLSGNVVDFIAEKFRKLPENTRAALEMASCIGSRFDLALLSASSKQAPLETAFDLWEGLERGFVSLPTRAYRDLREMLIRHLPPTTDPFPGQVEAPEQIIFEFQHDKLRLTIYSQISDKIRQSNHIRIGELLLGEKGSAVPANKIFEIVNHLNYGEDLTAPADEKIRLAELNRMAGRKAIDSRAYAQALEYYRTGERLLPETAWKDNYALIFALIRGQLECHYLNLDFDAAESVFRSLTRLAGTNEDRAEIYTLKMNMLASLAKHDDALRIGLAGLRLLGINMKAGSGRISVLKSILSTKLRLLRYDPESLLKLPRMDDRRLLLAMNILINSCFSAFLCSPFFAIVASLKVIDITLRHGNSKASPFGFMVYGVSMAAIFKKYKEAFRYGQLAMKANETFGSGSLTAKLLLIYGSGISIWCEPIEKGLESHRQGVKSALEAGDTNYAVYHIQSVVIFLIASGAPLDAAGGECDKYFKFVKNSKDTGALNYLISARRFVRALQGKTADPRSMDGDDFDEKEHIVRMEADAIPVILLRHHLLKLQLLYIMGDAEGALAAAEAGRKLLHYHLGTLIVPEFYFFHALALAAACRQIPAKKRSERLRALRRYERKLASIADKSTQNFDHKHLLVSAELAAVTGRDFNAIDLYQRAAHSAREGGFLHVYAIANERAAEFHHSRRFDEIGRTCLTTARDAWRKWGAAAKVAALERRHPEIPAGRLPDKTLAAFDPFDFSAVVGALQTISTEIVLSDLLNNLLRIVIENAGATRTQLLTLSADRIYLEAEHTADAKTATVYQAMPADGRVPVFTPVLNFVRRTSRHMVIEDATGHRDFAADTYVKINRPRSVLCLPVIRQNRLIALLYLENSIAPSVFTPARIEILQLLASQAAISLENARLFENVTKNEKELREISLRREEEFLRYQSQLRSLSSELSLTEERERRRIATELHDRIGHALATASMKLRALGNKNGKDEETARMINDIHSLIQQSIADTQTLTFELSPPILYDLGLEAALDWLAEQTQAQHGISVTCIDDMSSKLIDESLRVLLFQAARELVFNIVKHARAKTVTISVSREEDHVRVVIEDDGEGFDPNKPRNPEKKGGFGLFSIRERLAHQGGRLEIHSEPGQGTRITMISPMERIGE